MLGKGGGIPRKFANVDLHPKVVSNADMGHMFEELICRFAELGDSRPSHR